MGKGAGRDAVAGRHSAIRSRAGAEGERRQRQGQTVQGNWQQRAVWAHRTTRSGRDMRQGSLGGRGRRCRE